MGEVDVLDGNGQIALREACINNARSALSDSLVVQSLSLVVRSVISSSINIPSYQWPSRPEALRISPAVL